MSKQRHEQTSGPLGTQVKGFQKKSLSGLYERLNELFPKDLEGFGFQDKFTEIHEGAYFVSPLSAVKGAMIETAFLHFASVSSKPVPLEEQTKIGKLSIKTGLKFHISLPEWDRRLYRMACNVIIRELIRKKINSFKVVRDHERMSWTIGQEGKDFTIYVKGNPEMSLKDWSGLLNGINTVLLEKNVPPGYRILGNYISALKDYEDLKGEMIKHRIPKEARVQGSFRFYYRYEEPIFEKDPIEVIKIESSSSIESRSYTSVKEALQARQIGSNLTPK